MKIKLTLLALFLSITITKAQETVQPDNSAPKYKQSEGDRSIELNFDPGKIFGSDQGGQFSLPGGFKVRLFRSDFSLFNSESGAYRLGANFSINKSSDIIQQENPDWDQKELKVRRSYFSINLKPGYELHFKGTERLSPYVGGQMAIGFSRFVYKEDFQFEGDVYYDKWVNGRMVPDGSFNFGLGVFAGVDYYIIKKLYLGLEAGYGLGYTKKLKTKFSSGYDSDDDYEIKKGYNFSVSPYLATANFRIGWNF
ncbi:MAG: hypothetical protein ABFR62_04300 [Bacteroidota bacterium]